MFTTASLAFGLLLSASGVLGQTEAEIDPRHDLANPLKYIPKTGLAVAAGMLYLVIVAASLLWSRKRWARFMLTIIISGTLYAAGLFLRIAFGNSPNNLGIYIPMNTLTVLSPCGLIATVYMLLGRLAIQLDAPDFLLIRPQIITKLFLTSDIVTLLIQASGGGMAANGKLSKMGGKVFLVGLILQLISFILYTVVFGVFLYRMKTHRPDECKLDFSRYGFFSNWVALAGAMAISCIGILIRSVFRTIEMSEGFDGYLATHEAYFYVLDVLPLFVASAVFAIVWPPMYLSAYKSTNSTETAYEMGGAPNKESA